MENLEEYEEYIKNHPLCDFQQSSKWAKVKTFWQNEIIVLKDKQGNWKASLSILIRKVPFFGNLMYVPRGPIGEIRRRRSFSKLNKGNQKNGKRIQSICGYFRTKCKKR